MSFVKRDALVSVHDRDSPSRLLVNSSPRIRRPARGFAQSIADENDVETAVEIAVAAEFAHPASILMTQLLPRFGRQQDITGNRVIQPVHRLGETTDTLDATVAIKDDARLEVVVG